MVAIRTKGGVAVMFFIFVCVVAVATVVYVLEPVFMPSESEGGFRVSSEEAVADTDRIYQAILELDFDYRAGRFEDDEYQLLRERYLRQVAALLPDTDASRARPVAQPKVSETADGGCDGCGEPNEAGSRFCSQCGKGLEVCA